MKIPNIFAKRSSNENNTSASIKEAPSELSPEESIFFGGTKFSLYKLQISENVFYFIVSNDNIILYAFVMTQYSQTQSAGKRQIVFNSKGGLIEVKFFYSLNSSNDIMQQGSFYLANYKDLIKLFTNYNFKQTIEDKEIASLIISQSQFDLIDNLQRISTESFKPINSALSTPLEFSENKSVVSTEDLGMKIKASVKDIETGGVEEISKRANEIYSNEPPRIADPNYQIGFEMAYDDNPDNHESAKFVINKYTKRPAKCFISNRSKDLISLNQHVLISGVTGSGKTTFINNLTNVLLYHGVNVISLDIKLGNLDTPIDLITNGENKKEILSFMNDRLYKGSANVLFSGDDVYSESLITIKDRKNRLGRNIVPLMIYYRADDKNESENMRYFTRINILDLPELNSLRTLYSLLKDWKAGKIINSEKYKTLEDLEKEYNNKRLMYKNEINILLGLYINAITEMQLSIVESPKNITYMKLIIDNGSDALVKYIEKSGYEYLPSNAEFSEIVFNQNYLNPSDKENDPSSPLMSFFNRLIEAHEASKMIDVEKGIILYNILQDINSKGLNFFLILRSTPTFAMFYVLYSYYSVISLLADGKFRAIDEADHDSPLVTIITDEGTQLFRVDKLNFIDKYIKVLKEGQQQTRGIRISWMFGIQQAFKESFPLQTSLSNRIIFRAQANDINSLKATSGSIVREELFDAVMKQERLSFVSNAPIFIDEYGNIVKDLIIKSLPNRAGQVQPDGPINAHNYIELCENFLINNYIIDEYDFACEDVDMSIVNENGILLKPVDDEIKSIMNKIISTYNSNPLLDIKNDKPISKTSLMQLRKMMILFGAVFPDIKPEMDNIIKNEFNSYGKDKNERLIVKITEIVNLVNSRL